MVIDDSFPGSAQLPLFVSGLLVVAGGHSTLSLNSLLLRLHLFSMPLGPLGVLLGQGAVLDRLALMRIDRPPQLPSLRRVSVRFLTVIRCFGSKPLSQNPPLLRPAPDVSDGNRECGHRDYGYGDNENR
jgi:hypothetical protein